MKYYQVKELSKMTAVSVRALQYYDKIGLLKPSKRSEAGYRLYTNHDILRLQQITTLKYLGFSLAKIKQTLNNADFNVMNLMQQQAQALEKKAERAQQAAQLLQYVTAQVEAKQVVNWQSTAAIIQILEKDTMNDITLNKTSELGLQSDYDQSYNPDRLYPIPREAKRREIDIDPEHLPFFGFDCWNHYEVSWLNSKGKPMVAIAEIIYDCDSLKIIESKSLKLYFNSLNNTKINSIAELQALVKKDIEERILSAVAVNIQLLTDANTAVQTSLDGENIDNLDVDCSVYMVDPSFLSVKDDVVEETLYSDLLKSNCLVTNQPDWGSVQIDYQGHKINREGLLRYIVSYRNHNEFHEQCIERIFMDIMTHCKPKKLTVSGRYTRRGGLDINPYRSTEKHSVDGKNVRLLRQ